MHKLNFAHQESKWSPNTWSPNIDTGEGLMHRAGSSLHWDFWFLVWDIFSISNLYLLNWEGSDYPRSQPRTILFKLFFSSPRLTWKFSGREGRMAGVGSAKEIFGHLACAKGWPKRGKKKKCNFLYLLSLLHSRLCKTWQQHIDFSGVSFYNYKRKENYWLGRKTSLFCFVKESGSSVCSEEIEMH